MSLIMIRSLMCCFYCATNSDGFVKLIKKLDEFDQKLMEIGVEDGRKSNFIELTVKPLVSYVIVLLVIVTDLIGFSKSIVNLIVHKNFRRCAFLVCSFNGVWQVMPILLFIYFVKVIRRNFVVINDIIYKLIPDGDFLSVEKVDTSKLGSLKHVRLLRSLMLDAVKHLNGSYGSFLAISRSYVTVIFIINMYMYFFTLDDDIGLLVDIVIHAVILVVTVFSSTEAGVEVSPFYSLILLLKPRSRYC